MPHPDLVERAEELAKRFTTPEQTKILAKAFLVAEAEVERLRGVLGQNIADPGSADRVVRRSRAALAPPEKPEEGE